MELFLDWANVLIFLGVGLTFLALNLIVAKMLGLRPDAPVDSNEAKLAPYECGEPTIGPSWVRFDIRFYTIALLFIVFDVEVAFLFPWAVIFKGLGWMAFIEVVVFLAIVLVGFIYCWVKGDLEWVRSAQSQPASQDARAPRDAA